MLPALLCQYCAPIQLSSLQEEKASVDTEMQQVRDQLAELEHKAMSKSLSAGSCGADTVV